MTETRPPYLATTYRVFVSRREASPAGVTVRGSEQIIPAPDAIQAATLALAEAKQEVAAGAKVVSLYLNVVIVL